MLELLAALLARSPELFQSRRLLEECRTFVRQENGRAEAEQGAHDDAVMAMAIAASVRAQGGGAGPCPANSVKSHAGCR
jgi:hypothetical protein